MTSIKKLFDEEEIARRVEGLAQDIARTVPAEVTIVALLKGSFMFLSDLVRALDREGVVPRIEFLQVSSYGHAKESSGEVRLVGEAPAGVAGRSVLLVDDIVDTGRSLAYVKGLLEGKGAARVWTCALVDKPSRREIDFAADFVAFTVPNVFVVGYGIDYAERYRHLPYIGAVD